MQRRTLGMDAIPHAHLIRDRPEIVADVQSNQFASLHRHVEDRGRPGIDPDEIESSLKGPRREHRQGER